MGIFCGIYSGIMFPSAAISFLSSAERQMHPTSPLWARHPARTSCGSAAVRHRMFILWFSLMFSFWRWLNPPKIWYKSWMFILPNMVFQLLKPSKNMSMIVNDCQWCPKKKLCHVILLRRFDRAVRASTVTCAVRSLLLSSWKPLPQPICSQNLTAKTNKKSTLRYSNMAGKMSGKNGKSSTNNFQWEDLSIAMFEYQRVDLTWWRDHRKKVKDHKMSTAWPSTRTIVINCN